MGDDFWSYGLNDANRKTLDAMARYSYEQGLAVRLLTVEEMFADSTIGGETASVGGLSCRSSSSAARTRR